MSFFGSSADKKEAARAKEIEEAWHMRHVRAERERDEFRTRCESLEIDLSLREASLAASIAEKQAIESKFLFCADQLSLERLRNKELLDRLMALTDRRGLQTLRGEVPAPADTGIIEPTRSPFRPTPAGPVPGPGLDPATLEAMFRMPVER